MTSPTTLEEAHSELTLRLRQQELAADPAFIFRAEMSRDFRSKLAALQRDRSELKRFWSLPRPLRTNAQHVQELLDIYRGDASRADTAASLVTEQ